MLCRITADLQGQWTLKKFTGTICDEFDIQLIHNYW